MGRREIPFGLEGKRQIGQSVSGKGRPLSAGGYDRLIPKPMPAPFKFPAVPADAC